MSTRHSYDGEKSRSLIYMKYKSGEELKKSFGI